MRLIWVVIPLVLIGIIGIQESFASEPCDLYPQIYWNSYDDIYTGKVVSVTNQTEDVRIDFELERLLKGNPPQSWHTNVPFGSTPDNYQIKGADHYTIGSEIFYIENYNDNGPIHGGGYCGIGVSKVSNPLFQLFFEYYEELYGKPVPKYIENNNQESFADYSDEAPKYKAPLRQILDDKILPQNVQCNGDRILFFKIKTGSPMCIYERSIDRFDNTQIGWHGKGSPYFIELSDREYLNAQNSNLERTSFVNYKIDSQNNNILYNLSEQITKQDKSFLIYNSIFNDKVFDRNIIIVDGFLSYERNYSIVDTQGNDPVDWSDPRTSITPKSTTILDYGLIYRISCDENAPIQSFRLHEEASFKIFDGVETVHIQYPDKILRNYSETDTTFKDFFWSQDNVEFVFDEGLKEIAILEYSCISPLNSTSHVYEITFEVVN